MTFRIDKQLVDDLISQLIPEATCLDDVKQWYARSRKNLALPGEILVDAGIYNETVEKAKRWDSGECSRCIGMSTISQADYRDWKDKARKWDEIKDLTLFELMKRYLD